MGGKNKYENLAVELNEMLNHKEDTTTGKLKLQTKERTARRLELRISRN
jgi:hypothetical protein